MKGIFGKLTGDQSTSKSASSITNKTGSKNEKL
jgi:hypothetical protein